MRASDLKTNFDEPSLNSNDEVRPGVHPPPETLPIFAGGETVEDSGMDADEFTPEHLEGQDGEN